jgi:hypothetical protein
MNHTASLRIRNQRASVQQAARSGVFLSLFLSAFLLTGCVIVPLRTRTVGSTGEENRLDLNFIRVDKTTGDEVATKLAWMDTGLKHPRLFWGGWYASSSGGGDITAPLNLAPLTFRRWDRHNLLVEFNADGVVERFGDFSDSKLNEELERWSTGVGEPSLDLSAPLVIEVKIAKQAVPLPLTAHSAQFPMWNGPNFSVPRNDITRLTVSNEWDPDDARGLFSRPAPSDLSVQFSFSRGKIRKYVVDISPENYLTLVRYMAQTRGRP